MENGVECSVFLVEILVIINTLIKDRELPVSQVILYVDSQVAIKELSTNTVKSKLVAAVRH